MGDLTNTNNKPNIFYPIPLPEKLARMEQEWLAGLISRKSSGATPDHATKIYSQELNKKARITRPFAPVREGKSGPLLCGAL